MSSTSKRVNIYIVGAQCTGKTTLVNALESHFDETPDPSLRPTFIREVARTVLDTHGFTALDITSSGERCMTLQKLILDAQVLAERSALQEIHLVCVGQIRHRPYRLRSETCRSGCSRYSSGECGVAGFEGKAEDGSYYCL